MFLIGRSPFFQRFPSCVGVPDDLGALDYLDGAMGSLHRRSRFGPYDEFKWNRGRSLFRRGGGSHWLESVRFLIFDRN